MRGAEDELVLLAQEERELHYLGLEVPVFVESIDQASRSLRRIMKRSELAAEKLHVASARPL